MYYGQASQDAYCHLMNRDKKDGFFLEIGANHPIQHNNTYFLETQNGWRGVMVEQDPSFTRLYHQKRPLSIPVVGDATQVDYRSLLERHGFPTTMDYLQIDLDAENRSTLSALELLERTLFDKYVFGTATFEHDIYRGDFFQTRQRSRDLFLGRGYVLLFPDVCVYWEGKWSPFEDWYAHPGVVDPDLVQTILDRFPPEQRANQKHTDCIHMVRQCLE
jgi:hypothetical protein